MLFLRIKQAEVAFASNRLDEAISLVQQADVRAHRKGQELITRITAALMKRANKWLEMDRPADAAMDADKAIRLAGALPEAVQLKAEAAAAMLDSQHRHQKSADAVAKVRFHLNHGQLAAAQQYVDRGQFSTNGLQAVMEDLNQQADRAHAALHQARAAIARQDYETAVKELVTLQKIDSTNAEAVSLTEQLHHDLVEHANSAIADGRLDRAVLLEKSLSSLAPHALDAEQIRHALSQLRTAWDAVDRGQPRRAEEILRRLHGTVPDAKWLRESADRLSDAAAAIEAVRAGPMGLVAAMQPNPLRETAAPPGTADRPNATARVTPPPIPGSIKRPNALTGRFLLQVDGAGGFVVVRDTAVTVGPISSSSRVQVGFVCEPNTPSATIERVEDDYFLRGGSGVAVNDLPATSKLLGAGDRIALSPRCRMLFAMPVPASTTATVDLSGARHPRSDVRRIILMDRDVVIGPGGASHVRVDSLNDPVVLVQRDGQLFLRGGTAVTMGDQPIDENTALQPGQAVRGAGFGFVMTAI